MENKVSPEEYEKQLLEKSKSKDAHPLDSHAMLFKMFNPRLQGQMNFMSKRELIRLMISLAGSEFNLKSDINKLTPSANRLNLKGIRRVIASVIECPLQDENIKLLSKQEENLFNLFDGLLTQKYNKSIMSGLEKLKEDPSYNLEIENMIIHQIDTTSKEFNKRKLVEKDSFALANKILASKYLMMVSIFSELQTKEKENGK